MIAPSRTECAPLLASSRANGLMRRTGLLVLACAAVCAASAAGAAAEWQPIGEADSSNGGKMQILIDSASIKERHGVLTVWEKLLFSVPQHDNRQGKPYSSELEMWALDCKEERAALVSSAKYGGVNQNGAVTETMERTPGQYQWIEAGAGALIERLIKVARAPAPGLTKKGTP